MTDPQTDPTAIRAALGRGEIRRILAVRAARVGDTLHVRPALALLRQALPTADLVLLCSTYARPAARGAAVDRVVAYAHKGRGPGAFLARRRAVAELQAAGPIDLFLGLEDKPWGRRLARRLGCRFRHAASEGGLHVVERKAGVLRPLGLWREGAPPPVAWSAEPGARAAARALLEGHPRPWVGLQAGSHASRRLFGGRRRDPTPAWLTAAGRAIQAAVGGTLVVQAGRGAGEARGARLLARALEGGGLRVRLVGGLDLEGLGGLLAELDAYVSANTGPAHLAAALARPLVLLEGPSTPHARPWRPAAPVEVARLGLACSPCRGTPHGRRCRTPRCLDDLPPAQVGAAVARLLESR